MHQQFKAFFNVVLTRYTITSKSSNWNEELIERIGLADEASLVALKAERHSNQHWKILFLNQYINKQDINSGEDKNKGHWQGEAIFFMYDERKTMVVLADLA